MIKEKKESLQENKKALVRLNNYFMKRIGLILMMLIAAGIYFISCNQRNREREKLAEAHCQSCHKLPEADALDKKTWFNYVLPKMGSFMGFGRFDNGAYFENGKVQTTISVDEWNKIVNYYVSEAPD